MSAAHRSPADRSSKSTPRGVSPAIRNPARRSRVASRALPDKSPKSRGRNSHRGLFGSRLPSTASSPASKTSSATDSWTNALILIEARVRAAACDWRDAADGRHGEGLEARARQRDAADAITAECGRLRVLVRCLGSDDAIVWTAAVPGTAPAQPVPPPARRGVL